MTERPTAACTLLMLLLLTASGCWQGKPSKPENPPAQINPASAPATEPAAPATPPPSAAATTPDPTAQANAPAEPAAQAKESSEPPFTPPTLAELDAKAQWEDRPVLNSMKLLQADLAKSKPLVTVAEALAMKNNTAEDNEKILSALGRLPDSDKAVNWNASMNRYLIGDINSSNPIMQDTVMEADVLPLLTFGLFTSDWTLVPFADSDSVVSWQSSKDHLYDKVVMRRDLTWSDGKPITAHDVAFSFHAIMNPKIPVPAMRSDAEKLRDVVAYDDYTVVFFHKEPLATGAWHIQFSVIPQHIYEPLYAKLDKISFDELLQTSEYQQTELHPVSGNSYEMTSRIRNQEIVFKRRDDWFTQDGKQVREKPYFETITFRIVEDPNTALLALMSGRLDDYEIHQEQWATQTSGADFYDKNTKAFGVEWTYFYYGWNNNEPSAPFFKERKVREAMSYAVDYKELLDKLLYGLCQQCTGVSNPVAWFAPKTPLAAYHQDLDKASQLLDEAGWKDSDGDGIRDKEIDGKRVKFEFTMLCKNDPERLRICELLQFNLQQIGVQCNIQPMEATRLFDRYNKKQFQACFAGWGAGADPDADENVWATKAIADGRNFLQYSNPEVDKLFEDGRKEFDRDKRAAIYAKIDELIYRDQPCTFLYWRSAFFGYNKQLRGYKFSPLGPYHYSPGFSSIWKVAE